MNALVIGAGAIGQVIGYHLQKGGNRVTFRGGREKLDSAISEKLL